MSKKSERKKAIKAQKQREAASTPVVPPNSIALLSPRKWYAEDAVEFVEEHRKHCTDPTCNDAAIGLSRHGQKIVAMLFPQKLNEIFFAVYGIDTDEDYRPFISLQLANPEDIRGLFDANGSPLGCRLCGDEHEHAPMCLAFSCHHEGAVITVEPEGVVTIRCKTCRNWLRGDGIREEFRLAPRPKAEWPSVFCSHHGIEPMYIVCRHVLEEGKHAVSLWAADAENPGEALCEDCGKLRAGSLFTKENRALWRTTCQSWVDQHFDGRLKEALEEIGQSLYVLPSTVLNAPAASASVN